MRYLHKSQRSLARSDIRRCLFSPKTLTLNVRRAHSNERDNDGHARDNGPVQCTMVQITTTRTCEVKELKVRRTPSRESECRSVAAFRHKTDRWTNKHSWQLNKHTDGMKNQVDRLRVPASVPQNPLFRAAATSAPSVEAYL